MSLRLVEDWHESARCRGQSDDVFFPKKHTSTVVAQAKAICDQCPVIADCRRECDRAEGDTYHTMLFGISAAELPIERWRRRTGLPTPVKKPKPLVLRGRTPVLRPRVPMPRTGCQHRDHTNGHCWDCGKELA